MKAVKMGGIACRLLLDIDELCFYCSGGVKMGLLHGGDGVTAQPYQANISNQFDGGCTIERNE